jgi:hypothetical protein
MDGAQKTMVSNFRTDLNLCLDLMVNESNGEGLHVHLNNVKGMGSNGRYSARTCCTKTVDASRMDARKQGSWRTSFIL